VKIRCSIAMGVCRKSLTVMTLALCVLAIVGCSTMPKKPRADVVCKKNEPIGGVENLARLRQNKMRTVNLSTPEMKANFEPGQTLTLLDVEGAGQITRLHITMRWNDPMLPRKALLKIYWDGEENPSVMCPVGDFFCDAFCGESIPFATQYFGNHGKHWYCYLPMPFSNGCRIEIVNESDITDRCVAFDVTYEEWDECPDDLGRFHACWRRVNPIIPGQPFVMLDTDGVGHFVGCNISVQSLETPSLAFFEGFDYIWVDNEKEPSFKVWGTEDFFGGSFYFCEGPYAGPYSGATVLNRELGRAACYRLFIEDAISFKENIRVILNHGRYFDSGPIGTYEGKADYSGVAYWYQVEPHDSSIYQGHKVEDRLPLN